jgi:Tfp pilus assembly protein FimV
VISRTRHFAPSFSQPKDEQDQRSVFVVKPATFHYKSDKTGAPQFGLIGEEVAASNPNLVVRDEKGDIYTVRYDAVNAMLLNEFLKEHHEVAELKSIVTEQRKSMEAMAAQLKEQAEQIQKVSAQLETSKPAPQVVKNTD